MKEKLALTDSGFDRKPDLVVEVEYKRMRKLYDRDLRDEEKLYEIFIGGSAEPVGYIQQTLVSTSRSPRTSPIRWGIGSHMEWSWSIYAHTPEGKKWMTSGGREHNYPGIYGETRRKAVSDMLGYSCHIVEVVK